MTHYENQLDRQAPSGRLVVVTQREYEDLRRFGPPMPHGLFFVVSPLGGHVLAEGQSLEYLACALSRGRLSDDDLAFTIQACKHPHFVAELLFACGKIPEFAQMVSTQPAVAAHILALDGTEFPDKRAQAQDATLSILAKKEALRAIAEMGDL
jgi:hypothetical protein